MITRYIRQITLPEVGRKGQEKLKNTSVLCIGAGGIGSPVLLYLAACGIGRIGIVDHDEVELSNLHRQILYQEKDCGLRKVTIAKERLQCLHSDIIVDTFPIYLNHDNALSIIEKYDVVIDGTDNFCTRYLVTDACFHLQKPVVTASIHEFTGQIALFNQNNGPCYRCLYSEPPPQKLVPNCNESGVLGVTVGLIGLIAAQEIVKLILSLDHSLSGKLAIVDALSLEIRKINIIKNKDCILCCSKTRFEELPQYNVKKGCPSMTPEQLKNHIETNTALHLIDVREEWEHKEGCIPNSIHIPLGDLPNSIPDLPKDSMFVLYCKSGGRSQMAANIFQECGFTNVHNLEGGITEWMYKNLE